MKNLKILGTGCAKCTKLAERTAEAAEALGLECEIEKVTELSEIMKFGVMLTPALVVDGEVKVVGKVPSKEDIEALIK